MEDNTLLRFSSNVGSLIKLSQDRRTAERLRANQEFNFGLAFSEKPIDCIFTIKIDKLVSSWSGSLEIGVTTQLPADASNAAAANYLPETTWIYSGRSILVNGKSISDEYGEDMEKLKEGDLVSVERKSNGQLHFYLNGKDQGLAAINLPENLYAIVDLYGKCVRVHIHEFSDSEHLAKAVTEDQCLKNPSLHFRIIEGIGVELSNGSTIINNVYSGIDDPVNEDISKNSNKPFNPYICAVTNRPLKNSEIFEVAIVEKTTGEFSTFEIGIALLSEDVGLDLPIVISDLLLSGTSLLQHNGNCILNDDSASNLSNFSFTSKSVFDLSVGDTVGVVKFENGNLNFLINGKSVGSTIRGVNPNKRLFGIVRFDANIITLSLIDRSSSLNNCDSLLQDTSYYHTLGSEYTFSNFHGSDICLLPNMKTLRRNNHSRLDTMAFSSQPLVVGKPFSLVIDAVSANFSGSLSIGFVDKIIEEFPVSPFTFKERSYFFTPHGLVHNGVVVRTDVSCNSLVFGDVVSVCLRSESLISFSINNNVAYTFAFPHNSSIFAAVDIAYQVWQSSILSNNVLSDQSGSATDVIPLAFETNFHGKNCIVEELKAKRPNASDEFNDAIVMSNRPLLDNEIFEVHIDSMIERWSGSIEIGLTSIPPDKMNFPSTMTDLDNGIWMVSGSSLMQNGNTILNGYSGDLDLTAEGMDVGVMRCGDNTLHIFIDGVDYGIACVNIPPKVYAIIDLYGQCAEISLLNPNRGPFTQSELSTVTKHTDVSRANVSKPNVFEKPGFELEDPLNATRQDLDSKSECFFSQKILQKGEVFEIYIGEIDMQLAGSLKFGISNKKFSSALKIDSGVQLWYWEGCTAFSNTSTLHIEYSLENLSVGNHIAVMINSDNDVVFILNGERLQTTFHNVICDTPYAYLELYGKVKTATISKFPNSSSIIKQKTSLKHQHVEINSSDATFNPCYGRHITLLNSSKTAIRSIGYNYGITIGSTPFCKSKFFQFRIDKKSNMWKDSFSIGVISSNLISSIEIASNASSLTNVCFLLTKHGVFIDRALVDDSIKVDFSKYDVGSVIGMYADSFSNIHLLINGVENGVIFHSVDPKSFPFVDMYGQLQQISIVPSLTVIDRSVEKAARVDTGKETMPVPYFKCEYFMNCQRFKNTLRLPLGYFDQSSKGVICYCPSCHKLRGDDPYYKQGDPLKPYAVPLGWCKYVLKHRRRLPHNVAETLSNWHVAYYGVDLAHLRKCLDSTELLYNKKFGIFKLNDLKTLNIECSLKECFEDMLFISPTLAYCAQNCFLPPIEYYDSTLKMHFNVQAALEVFVRPGCYMSRLPSVVPDQPYDKIIPISEIEWFTKENGAIILSSLLLHLQPRLS